MGKSKARIELNSRDLDVLEYLWDWKVANTMVLKAKFFRDCHSRYAYRRLNKLKRHKLVELTSKRNASTNYWTLSKNGFEAIRHKLPELKEVGFRSENIEHDFLCSLIHQGDYLTQELPSHVLLTTEQQLRRYHIDVLLSAVQDVDFHRPDGYWLAPKGNGIQKIALELELTRKSTDGIDKAASYYATYESGSRVIWVVESVGLLNRIESRLKKANPGLDIHNFLLLKDIRKSNWSSVIYSGPEYGKTLRECLISVLSTTIVPSQYPGTIADFLDNRLSLRNFNNKLNQDEIKNSLL